MRRWSQSNRSCAGPGAGVTRRSTLQARHRRTADQQAITEIVMSSVGKTGLQLRSLIKASGELEISLADVLTPEPVPLQHL